MKILQIIETAYRATIEEQDDTIVWLTHAMRGAGGDFSVLLRGNAVNYAVPGQNAEGLSFGTWEQTQPPQIADDIAGLIGKGVEILAVQEDLTERGLGETRLIDGVEAISRSGLAFAPTCRRTTPQRSAKGKCS